MPDWVGAQAIQKTEFFASSIFLFAVLKNGLCLRPLLQRQNRSLSSEAHFRTPHDGELQNGSRLGTPRNGEPQNGSRLGTPHDGESQNGSRFEGLGLDR